MKSKHLAGLVAVSLSLSFVAPTAASASPVPAETGSIESESFTVSGEELFRGIMFSEGPVAPELAAVQPVAPHDNNSRAVVNFVVDRIEAEDPSFLHQFGKEVQSGDPGRTQAIVEEASVRTMGALIDGEYVDPAAVAAGEVSPTCFAIQVVVVIAAAAVYAYAGMLQVQAVATYNWYAETTVTRSRSALATAEEFSLEYENWIAGLTSTLAAE